MTVNLAEPVALRCCVLTCPDRLSYHDDADQRVQIFIADTTNRNGVRLTVPRDSLVNIPPKPYEPKPGDKVLYRTEYVGCLMPGTPSQKNVGEIVAIQDTTAWIRAKTHSAACVVDDVFIHTSQIMGLSK